MMLQQPAEESPEPSVRRWLGRVATRSRLGLALHDGHGTGVATGRHSASTSGTLRVVGATVTNTRSSGASGRPQFTHRFCPATR